MKQLMLLIAIVGLCLVTCSAEATDRQRFVQKEVRIEKQNREGFLQRLRNRGNRGSRRQAQILQFNNNGHQQRFEILEFNSGGHCGRTQAFLVPESFTVRRFSAPRKVEQFNSGDGHAGCRAMLGH